MDTHKPVRLRKKPSTLLGFCVCGLPFVVVAVCYWQFSIYGAEPKSKLQFSQPVWIAFGSACIALFTWLGTSWVALRNSIKQHTITTLLQMRLSATYMGYADKVSAHFLDYDSRRKKDLRLGETEQPTDKVDIAALRYILNYFEFLAIGVSRGDFDEDMLKSSLRSILRKNVQMSRGYIKESQSQNPHLYEHLAWLHDRWCEDQPRLSLPTEKK